jgi:peptide/nickel transport system substrate-binding protein
MAEDVDAFAGFPAPENIPQFEADPRFQVLKGNTEGETILSTNNKMPPFDNKLVRKAVAHAIDRQAIIDGRNVWAWHAHRHALRTAQP